MVWKAFKDVKASKGGAGVDGETIEVFEKDLANNLFRIWNRLSSGSYFPPPVRRVEIPKRDGGVRGLGVPTVGDRIAQAVVRAQLEAVVEPGFHPDSYGYRPGRSAHQAVHQARSRCWSHKWVVDLDIRAFFDSLDHELMMRALRRFTDCPWVLLYVERWLTAAVRHPDGHEEPRLRGVPQGGVISPLLANMFLHLAFDQWMAETFPDVPFERYADDVIIHCRTQRDAERILAHVRQRLRRCRLELNAEKTRVVCTAVRAKGVQRSFDFLGFTFRTRLAKTRTGALFPSFGPAISTKAAKGLRETMRRQWRLTSRTELDLGELARRCSPALRGWIGYYGRFRPSELTTVFRGINLALRIWATRKYKRFKRRPQAAMAWLRAIAMRDVGLWPHWKFPTLLPTVGR